MPLITGDITDEGAVIGVLVGVSANRKKALQKVNLLVPESVSILAVIDSGSFATGFPRSVLQKLEIHPFDNIPVRTPSTKRGEPCHTDLFDVSVTLLSGDTLHVLPSVHAIASDDFDEEGIQAIIGRDVLRHCTFLYNGPENSFQLAFP